MIGSFRLPICVTSSGDTTLPTITSATVENVNPNKLVVVFSEVVSITNTTGLTITGAATPTLSAPTGSGSNTITFTLSTALTNGQSVTLNVASSNTIKDAANNALAATTKAITNNVAAVAGTALPKSANLVGYFKMDTTTGLLINEVGADGTAYGSLLRGEVGKIGNAIKGNGTNAYVDCPNINEGSSYGFSFWMETANNFALQFLMSRYTGNTNRSVYIHIYEGKFIFQVNGASFSISIPISTNIKQHIVCTASSGGTMEIYVDKVLKGSVATPIFTQTNTSLKLLSRVGTTWFGTALIDELAIYNTKLDQADVDILNNNGAGITY